MSTKLRTYPEYKDSGLPWLGKIPAHWEVKRLKRVTQINPSKSEARYILDRGDQVTFLPMERVGSDGRINPGSVVPADSVKNGFTYFRKGDVLVAKITPCFENGKGACLESLPTEIGFGSTEFIVMRSQNKVIPQYLYRITTLPEFRKQGAAAMTGSAGQQRVSPDFVGNYTTALPPIAEQETIITFLDYTDQRIARFIRTKRRLIQVLNEQKQAIIHQAVTRGLDPDVKLKPSGVEWLGDVPEHWEMRKAKQLCHAIIDCKNRTPEMVEDGQYVVVRTTCVRHGKFDLAGSYTTDSRNHKVWTLRGAPRLGDVFFTREAPSGEACLVPENNNLCMGQRMMYFRPDPELLDPRFLLQSIYGPVVRTYVEHTTSGSTVGHLRLGQVYSLPLLWCPLEEQRQIVSYVEDHIDGIDTIIARTQREIDLIREYRTRLIADVVTGKLDVRGVDLPTLDNSAHLEDAIEDVIEDGEELDLVEEGADGEE